jgi:hypothetical protein
MDEAEGDGEVKEEEKERVEDVVLNPSERALAALHAEDSIMDLKVGALVLEAGGS